MEKGIRKIRIKKVTTVECKHSNLIIVGKTIDGLLKMRCLDCGEIKLMESVESFKLTRLQEYEKLSDLGRLTLGGIWSNKGLGEWGTWDGSKTRKKGLRDKVI